MNKDDLEFIYAMVKQLDESIRCLHAEEQRILTKIDQDRLHDLNSYWNQTLMAEDAQEIKASFDYWEKLLIMTWARLHRIQQTRVQAGQAIMKSQK